MTVIKILSIRRFSDQCGFMSSETGSQSEFDIFELSVAPAEEGLRLDRFLANRLPELSRMRLKALIKQGHVQSMGATITNPSGRVKSKMEITVAVPPPEDATPLPEKMDLEILFEDAHLIVINKPAGLVVHPAPGNYSGTLVNGLLAHCGDSLSGIGGVRRPGIVHRLDKDTSGVMVAAKSDRAHAGLSELFAKHDLERAYRALVWGLPSPTSGVVRGDIGRHPINRKKMAVVEKNGKAATTYFKLLQPFGTLVSEIECILETGRTHQIRVHMSHSGHPVVGDPLYGRNKTNLPADVPAELADALKAFSRQALHAAVLGFQHPVTGETLKFEHKAPYDMMNLTSILRKSIQK
jgi:23S rRNA pseudouridine1911/1915/1917 synthase